MSRRAVPPPPPPAGGSRQSVTPSLSTPSLVNEEESMQSPHLRLSTIPVQPSFASIDVEIPEPPLTEAGKWTFHSQKELPPPPPFEKRLRRYPTGAETGCSIPLDLSHLRAFS